MRRPGFHRIVLAALLLPSLSMARPAADLWGFDPGVLAATGGDLLQRAPDPQVDALFQAVHAVARNDNESGALCALFEPKADRSIAGLDAFASQLGPASRSRFADALADLLLAAVQSPAQAFDRAAAKQSLKGAAVTAALLHDGFTTGLQAGDDADGRSARCQSLRWLLDAMQSRPPGERAAMTRFLLDEGLSRIATGAS
ncbi:hypothetical protein [Cognatiluteimonas profundi]|uniref:hypothetical protein n=1 Tax=Cognatiluteimonas profundi TaxID=2594501 RepID=UPI00131D1B39|nr:hypothetical protein [Lysobacter profundi]